MSVSFAALATVAYVPPFKGVPAVTAAAGTAGGAVQTAVATAVGAASTSFARVGTLGYGTAAASATATAAISTDGAADSFSLLYYFTVPYIDAHTLSQPTWRYAYVLWMAVVGTLVLWSIASHASGNGGFVSAAFRKVGILRIAWGTGRKTEKSGGKTRTVGKKGWFSPTVGQMTAIVLLIGMAVCLSVLGENYIAPTACTFGGDCGFQGGAGPPRTTFGSSRKRSDFHVPVSDTPAPPQAATRRYTAPVKRGVNNINGYAPFNDPLLAAPNYSLSNLWTSAARLGLISYALFPLTVTLALKQWPWNIWATPFLTNYGFDKTAILHRWSGRVIWAFSTAHTVAWTIQLMHDQDPFSRPVFVDVWLYWRFVAGAVAYVCLTLLVILSFAPLRNRFYEFFYWSHIVLVAVLLAGCLLHSGPLAWWPIAALALWVGERASRFLLLLWDNRIGTLRNPRKSKANHRDSFQVVGMDKVDPERDWQEPKRGGSYPPPRYYGADKDQNQLLAYKKQSSYYDFGPGQDTTYLDQNNYPRPAPPSVPHDYQHTAPLHSTSHLPSPGYCLAQLLPGRTVRLTIHAPGTLRWRPGQHIFLTIPSIALFQAHPYTIVSVDQRSTGIAPFGGVQTRGTEIVLLVRAQKGFSRTLWKEVAKKRLSMERAGTPQAEIVKGVELRTIVSRPLGSAVRADWDGFESLLIVVGGTGITFGMTVLEYACTRMARRGFTASGEKEGKVKTSRVRLVWILREFAHLTWVAPALRRCLEMSNSQQLQIDLFVTQGAMTPLHSRRQPDPSSPFLPPNAPFARQARPGMQSSDSMMSDVEDDGRAEYEQEQMDSVTDLVLFDGEDEERTPGEVEVSRKVQGEGRIRRANSRRTQGQRNQRPDRSQPPNLAPEPQYRPQNDARSHSFDREPQPQFHEQGYDSPRRSFNSNRPSPAPSPHRPSHYTHSTYAHSTKESSFVDLTPDDQSEHHSLAGYSSVRELVSQREHASVLAADPNSDDLFLDVTAQDQEDLDVIAELARGGYPALKQILAEEVERSEGRTMVACCGPTALNSQVRSLVSAKIDLGRILRGDKRGDVQLVCEDFSF